MSPQITIRLGGLNVRSDDWATFSGYSLSKSRKPNFVVQVIYTDETISFTKEPVTSNLTGTIIDGAISSISSVSQQVFPLEGRTQIGGVTIKLLDTGSPSTFTEIARAQLAQVASPYSAGESLRNNKVKVFAGFTDDFDDYVNVATTFINEVSINNQEYTLSCLDITRQMRRDIFEQKETRLAANLSAPSVSPQSDIAVTTVEGFAMCEHTAGFTDAPNVSVGYLRVKDTGEIIRYTGISESPVTFTGITREVFGSVGGAVTVNLSEDQKNWPEVEEVIYLEMPAPQMGYALLTGVILGSSPEITIPVHWHMGIPTEDVATAEWESIGTDLYESDTSGMFVRFLHMKKTDGKQFIESEIHRLIGTYSPIRTDGSIGLGRINQVLSTASYIITLSEINIVKHSGLRHAASDVVNQYRIDYEWDGSKFLRSLALTDADSIARNKIVKEKVLKFKGLYVSRHSELIIYSLVNALQNRYRNPPQEMTISVMPYLDVLEPADIVRVVLPKIKDMALTGGLMRSFEIQSTRIDWVKGNVSLGLFASSGSASDPLITPAVPVLNDAFYTSKGTDIDSISPSVVDGSGNLTSDFTLTGNADMNNAAAIYYYDGSLTIGSGFTLTIGDNVQLRVKGTITVNGDIDGIGQGNPAGVTAGYIGNTRAQDGVTWTGAGKGFVSQFKAGVSGAHSSFPSLTVSAGDQSASPQVTDVSGIPSDLRGTSGSAGGSVFRPGVGTNENGGAGGASGAGLCIIARQVAFGASGMIDLSGADGTATTGSTYTLYCWIRAGAGAGGGSGALLIMIDGAAALPALETHYTAEVGLTPVSGTPTNQRLNDTFYDHNLWPSGSDGRDRTTPSVPGTGYALDVISGQDNWLSSNKIIYIPDTA